MSNLFLQNYSKILLSDVANVTYDYPEKDSYERMDGRDAVTVEIRKTSTANLVSTADRVKAEMALIQEEIGADRLIVTTVRDRSVDVTQGINNLAQSAILGGLLAILVIYIFLLHRFELVDSTHEDHPD